MADFEEKVTLIKIEIDQEASFREVDRLTKAIIDQKNKVSSNNDSIKTLNETNKELAKQVKKGTITQEKSTEKTKENSKQIDDLRKKDLNLKDGLKDLNKERTQAVKVSLLQSNSLEALRNKVIGQKKELNGLNTATEKGRKRFEELTKELEENNNQIVKNDQSAGDFKTTIGRYREEVGGAIQDTGGFSGALGGVSESAQQAGGRFSQLFKLLKANPLIFLVGIIAGLIGAFANLGDNVKFLEPIFAGVGAVIDTIIGRIGKLGGAIFKLIQGDFKGAFEDAKGAVTGLGDEIESAFKQGKAIKELEESIRSLNRELLTVNEILQGQSDFFQQVADDATLSFEQQQKAAAKVVEIQEELFQNKVKEAQQNEKLLASQLALARQQGKDVRDLLDQEAEAQTVRLALENEFTLFKQENATLQRQIAQDVFEQDLDFAIDIGTRRTEEALKASENEKLSIEERQEALQKARGLDEQAFNTQLSLFEGIGLSREKINQLINESNAEVIASELKKTELSEIERNRFKELILERQSLTTGLNEAEKGLEEARDARVKKQLGNQKALDSKLAELAAFRREQENQLEIEAAESDEEQFELKTEQQQERFEIEQELLIEQREEALESEILSNEEKLLVEADFLLQKEQLIAENEDVISQIEADADKTRADNKKKVDAEDLKKEKEKRKKISAIVNQALSTAVGVSDAFFATKNNRIDSQNKKETNDLIRQLNIGQITREEFDRKKENLDKDSARKAFQLQKKQFIANKIIAIAETIVNTAKGIMGAIASIPGPVGIALGVLVGILGTVQTVAIASEQPPSPPSFAQGGDVFGFTVGGKSHSQGGTKYKGEDGNVFEVEKDEGIFVLKREATNPALAMLSSVNERYHGNSLFSMPRQHLQEGGAVGNQGISNEQLAEIVEATIGSIPPQQVQVVDIMAGLQGNVDAENTGVI